MGKNNNRRRQTMLSWAVMKDGRALWSMNAVPRRAVYGESLRSFSGTEFALGANPASSSPFSEFS